MSKNKPQTFTPSSKNEWRKWLEKNHLKEDFVWLIMYKKSTGISSVSWGEAVDEALCFGWIDSTKRAIDDEKYMQYFGKRKANSTWSKINKDKVGVLLKQGLIKEAGLKSIGIAKENGSWTILDDVENLIIPEDLEKAFKNYNGSKEYFMDLTKTLKKGMLYWIVSAKRSETREKRIQEIVESTGKREKPKQFQ